MSQENISGYSEESLKDKMKTEQFELFKKAPAGHAMQKDLDLKTLVASMIVSLEEANKVVSRVSIFSKNPLLDQFSHKLNNYMQSLSTVIEPDKKPSDTPSSTTP